MRVLLTWLFRIAAGLVVLTVLGVVLVYYLASQSLPDYSKTVAVQGVSAPVEIVRDNANVPHIMGATDADVFFGLGYAHAQDRLWQMTLLRRTAQGRLSEVFGAPTLKVDRLLRRMDLYRLAMESVAAGCARRAARVRPHACASASTLSWRCGWWQTQRSGGGDRGNAVRGGQDRVCCRGGHRPCA